MSDQSLQLQIIEINRKLDIILEEVSLQQRHRREMEDLKDDLMRVGKDLYQTAISELEDIHDSFNTGDILYLGKKVLRNVATITKTFEQLESLRDFIQDGSPLAREAFIDFMNRLDELDRKGYFAFMNELGRVMDKVVTSFTPEDVRNLGENIVTIINTVKSLTQPDMLHTINNAITLYRKLDIDVSGDISLLSLMKEANTPEARRGLAFAIRFLKSIAATNDTLPAHG